VKAPMNSARSFCPVLYITPPADEGRNPGGGSVTAEFWEGLGIQEREGRGVLAKARREDGGAEERRKSPR